jgi:hypothetical protein
MVDLLTCRCEDDIETDLWPLSGEFIKRIRLVNKKGPMASFLNRVLKI